jgi:hypothetical protein
MRNLNRQTAFLWIAALATPLMWPAPAAYAQVESLADWSAKAKAGGYAEPLKPDNALRFGDMPAALRTGAWPDPVANPPACAEFYNKRIFPVLTHSDSRGTRLDPALILRSQFKQLDAHPGSQVGKDLADITLAYMVPIAKDPKWHPSVRENALLAIGELKTPKAVEALLQLIRDRNLHPTFKIVAMADLVHLAERDPAQPNAPNALFSDSAVAGPVVTLMTAAARSSPEKPADSLIWMRGQAADILGSIGSTGANGEVVAALLGIVADEKMPLIVRGQAARALGKLNYGGSPPNAAEFAKAFAAFGSTSLDAGLPGPANRIGTACDDFLGGLKPVAESKEVSDVYGAMGALRKVVVRPKPPSEEELKPAVEKARKVLDAAAGKK